MRRHVLKLLLLRAHRSSPLLRLLLLLNDPLLLSARGQLGVDHLGGAGRAVLNGLDLLLAGAGAPSSGGDELLGCGVNRLALLGRYHLHDTVIMVRMKKTLVVGR